MNKEQFIANKLRGIGIELTPGEVRQTVSDFTTELKKRLTEEKIPFPDDNDELMDIVASTKKPDEWIKLMHECKGEDPVEFAVAAMKELNGTETDKPKGLVHKFLKEFATGNSDESAVENLNKLRPLVVAELEELGFHCPDDKDIFAEMIVAIVSAGDAITRAMRKYYES